MTDRPNVTPQFATTDTVTAGSTSNNVIEPSAAIKALGIDFNEKFGRNYLNWVLKTNYLWQQYFEDHLDQFAVAEQSTPDMTVEVKAGVIQAGATIIAVAVQNSATITAPTTNPRIDVIYLDSSNTVGIKTGTEAVSPSVPAITAAQTGLAYITLATSTTTITTDLITPYRSSPFHGLSRYGDTLTGNLTVTGTTLFNNVTTHGGNVVSDTDSTDDLGTTGVRWANLYVDDIIITTNITAGGTLQALTGGIGLARTKGTFHIQTGSAGSITTNPNADDIVVENSTNCGLSVLAPDSNWAGVFFGSASNNTGSKFRWNYSTLTFEIGTDAANSDILIKTGSAVTAMTLFSTQGVNVGSPTGGDKGSGTINALAVYDDNTLLTCYVFDQQLDNKVDLIKWDLKVIDTYIKGTEEEATKVDNNGNLVNSEVIEIPDKIIYRQHNPLRKFQDKVRSKYNPLNIDSYAQHWKDKRHLTSMPNETKYDPEFGALSAGEWIQRLVETVEIQAIHIDQLNKRVKVIESL